MILRGPPDFDSHAQFFILDHDKGMEIIIDEAEAKRAARFVSHYCQPMLYKVNLVPPEEWKDHKYSGGSKQ